MGVGKQKSSSGNVRCKYLLTSFWIQNAFWETDLYSEKTKDHYRKWLAKLAKDEKYLPNLIKR